MALLSGSFVVDKAVGFVIAVKKYLVAVNIFYAAVGAVVVVCDVWSALCMHNFKNSTPFFRREEIRCSYVGVTRSKRTLYMYRPACNSKYEDHFPLLEKEKYDRT